MHQGHGFGRKPGEYLANKMAVVIAIDGVAVSVATLAVGY
jgi:hypothetical protein